MYHECLNCETMEFNPKPTECSCTFLELIFRFINFLSK